MGPATEAWLASAVILGALWAAKAWAAALPGGTIVMTAAVGLQLYGPLLRVGKNGVTWESLGLTWAQWPRDLAALAVVAALTFPPYVLGFHYWQTELLGRAWAPSLPSGFLWSFFSQTLVLALAEEVFFRGYLQERFDAAQPPRRRLLGAAVGPGLLWATLVFALAHFVGEWNPLRMAPFFPGLLFGLLRARTGTIVAATAYHAACNALADLMFASYS